jgi:hypothetical protein
MPPASWTAFWAALRLFVEKNRRGLVLQLCNTFNVAFLLMRALTILDLAVNWYGPVELCKLLCDCVSGWQCRDSDRARENKPTSVTLNEKADVMTRKELEL